MLIEKGADVSAKDYVGRSPLYTAIRKNMITTVDKLMINGADGKLYEL